MGIEFRHVNSGGTHTSSSKQSVFEGRHFARGSVCIDHRSVVCLGFFCPTAQGLFHSIEKGWCSAYLLGVGTVVFGSGVACCGFHFVSSPTLLL